MKFLKEKSVTLMKYICMLHACHINLILECGIFIYLSATELGDLVAPRLCFNRKYLPPERGKSHLLNKIYRVRVTEKNLVRNTEATGHHSQSRGSLPNYENN